MGNFWTSEPIIQLQDFILGPIYLLLIMMVGHFWKKAYYSHSEIGKYFLPGLGLRMLGAILSAAIYQYYYGVGDAFRYFHGAEDIWDLFMYNPVYGIAQIFSAEPVQFEMPLKYIELDRAGDDVVTMQKLGGALLLLTFKSFLPASFLISAFSFAGAWKLFKTFTDMYPEMHKEFAIACLYLPSLWFWGSGFLKDPLCMGALGYLTYSSYMLFVKKRPSIADKIPDKYNRTDQDTKRQPDKREQQVEHPVKEQVELVLVTSAKREIAIKILIHSLYRHPVGDLFVNLGVFAYKHTGL